jgi:DNA-binding CsgD family transcriptional regulator
VIRANDLSEVLRVSETASSCVEIEQLREAVLDLIPNMFHVDRATFYLTRSYPAVRLDFDNVAMRGVERKYAVLFRKYYWKMDPVLKMSNLPRTVISLQDILGERGMVESEWYHDFLKPQGVRDLIATNLRIGNSLKGVMVLIRSTNEPAFAAREMVKAELLAPHLAAAVEKAILLEKVRKTEQIIAAICQELPKGGLLVVDESLAPVYANEEARKTLAQIAVGEEPPKPPFVPLPKALHLQCQKLFQNVASTTDLANNQQIDLMVPGEKGAVSADISLVQDSKALRLCLIRFGRTEQEPVISVHLKKLGLSRRELELIGLVCEGFKNKEIGEKLFISENTVETHLRSIYEKLDVKNRTSLAHKVTRLAVQK